MRAAWISLLALGLLGPGLPVQAGRASFEDLVANLKSPLTKTRQEAAIELGKTRRREAVAPLAALVRDPEPKVRVAVVRALRELRDLSAVPALVTSLKDGDLDIREEAITALVELYGERERESPIQRFLSGFSDEFDRSSLPPYFPVDPIVHTGLAEALRDESPRIREEAGLALGILNGKSQVAALAAALQDPEADVRAAAAGAIGKVGTRADGKALIGVLADESSAVRHRALYALGTLRVAEAGPVLRQMYDATKGRDSVRVLEALSRIEDPQQMALFRELVQDPDREVRRLAVEGLGRIADASLLPAFKKDFQRERSEEMRLAYAFALTKLGDRAFMDTLVLSLPSRTARVRCQSYILEMGREVVPELYPYLNDPDAEIRAALCDLLAQIGDPDAIARLTPLIQDPSSKVADRANRAVEHLRRASGRES